MEPAVERAPTIVDAPSPLAPASEPSEGTEESSNPKRRLLVYAAVVLSALAIWLSSLKFGSHKPTTRINGVARSFGDRPATIRLTGTTEAVHMRSIIAPILEGEHMGTLTLTKLVASGSKVHKGDILAEFDRQTQMRDFIDKQAQYEDLADKVIQEQAKEDAARAADETEIAAAKSNLGKAELESQKIELLSRIDAEKKRRSLGRGEGHAEAAANYFRPKTSISPCRHSFVGSSAGPSSPGHGACAP
jgi:multidrug efflux pump subunit AcrA (membrane-fusion protein)